MDPIFTCFRFHDAIGHRSHKVELWLQSLEDEGGEYWRKRMLNLIRQMLSEKPDQRPRAIQVLASLQGIAALSLAESAKKPLRQVWDAYPNLDHDLAQIRFQSWISAIDQLLNNASQAAPEVSGFDFDQTTQALQEIHRIAGFKTRTNNGVELNVLQYQLTRLVEALSPFYRTIADERFKNRVLSKDGETQSDRLFTEIKARGEKDLERLLALRRLTALAKEGLINHDGLNIDKKQIIPGSALDIHQVALLKPASEPIIVERLKCQERWADKEVGEELRRRISSVVGLLCDKTTTTISGTLPCKGIFYDPFRMEFGIVYEQPPGMQPFTLHSLLGKKELSLPPLECRFRLALTICQCIFTFHRVRWLHRNLNSMNVLLFLPQGSQEHKLANDARIIGFADSRENRLGAFTYGPDADNALRHYQHPAYLTHRETYREEFDYYSIGILLLEIGLWRSLSHLTDVKRGKHFQGVSDERFREEIVTRLVPSLDLTMGTRYRAATRTCLTGDFDFTDATNREDTWFTAFKTQVIDSIQRWD